jgi:LPXTG-motif cell wall-anchored protein
MSEWYRVVLPSVRVLSVTSGLARLQVLGTFAALVVALAGLAAPVQAEAISGTFEGDATLTPTGTTGIYTQNFTGDGDDTTFGAFTPTSQSTIDFSSPPNIAISAGTFLETFTNGTLFGTSSGSGTASGKGTATFTIDVVFTGGTGLFTGYTGEATLTGTITQTSPTTESISNGSYNGSLTAVPEPTMTTSILGIGLLALSGVFLRRRK